METQGFLGSQEFQWKLMIESDVFKLPHTAQLFRMIYLTSKVKLALEIIVFVCVWEGGWSEYIH